MFEPDRSARELSRRERQILVLLCDGATTAQIAFAFGLAPATVEKQILSARRKLRVANRVELVAYAFRHEVLPIAGKSRPGVVEIVEDDRGETTDFRFRYVSGDGYRDVPVTNHLALNRAASDWAGPSWNEDLEPLLRALGETREGPEWVPFENATTVLAETGDAYEWSGSVSEVNKGRFLVVVDTPLPISSRGGLQ